MSSMVWNRPGRIALLFVLTQALSASPQTTSVYTVSGIILDASGASVAGTKVTLGPTGWDSLRTTVTDWSGQFEFSDVAPGNYEIEALHPDFRVAKTRIQIRSKEPKAVTIVLKIASLHEEFTVHEGDGGLSTEIPQDFSTITLNEDVLAKMPSLDQDVVGTLSEMVEAISGEKAVIIEDGLPVSKAGVSRGEIQEVKISKDPYSAEYSEPGSRRIEIESKGGTKKLHGSASFSLRDYHLDGRNAFATDRPREHRGIYSGDVTGPLGQSGKTTFVAAFTRDKDDRRSVVNALTSQGPVRENVPRITTTSIAAGRLQHALNDSQGLSFGYRFVDWGDQGELVGGFNLPEIGVDYRSRKHEARLSHKAAFSSNLLNEFTFGAVSSESAMQGRNPGVRQIVVLDAFTGGGAQRSAVGRHDYVQLVEVLSWSKGRHLIKAGLQVPTWSRHFSDDRSNFDGTFYFSTLDEFDRRQPFAFVQNAGDSRLSYRYGELGWFLQDYIRIRDNLSVGLGLRHQWQSHVANRDNLAPRLSVAYAPGRSRKTVIRAGAGIFYETTGDEPIADVLRLDGRRLRRLDLVNPGYPDPLVAGTQLPESSASVATFDPTLRAPYSVHYTAGVERQLTKSTTLTASYVGIKGVNLFRSRDLNAPVPPLFLARPNPAYGVLRHIESSGNSMSRQFKLGLQGQLAPMFKGGAYYTLGRLRNDTDGIGSFPADNHDLSSEWGRFEDDALHRLYLYGTLEAGKLFSLGVIVTARSGKPYTITTGFDENADTRALDRPLGVGRNTMTGPSYFTLDLQWSKSFELLASKNNGKGTDFTVSIDAFNALNQVNRHSFVGNVSSPFFGRSVSAEPARRLQFSGKVSF